MRTSACATTAVPSAAIGFRTEFLDFQRGIRVGKLEEHERITRLLKLALEAEFGEPFVTERWGRGMYWRWIGYLPRANRAAKPESAHVSFGCSKFFIMVDTEEQLFKCGMQVERGYIRAPRECRDCELRPDWDWHRLVKRLTPKGPIEREDWGDWFFERASEYTSSWEFGAHDFSGDKFPGVLKLRRVLNSRRATGRDFRSTTRGARPRSNLRRTNAQKISSLPGPVEGKARFRAVLTM